MGIGVVRGVSEVKEMVMESETPDSVQACAIEWHIRLRDADGETWDAFAAWLASDPRHPAAYNEIEQSDRAIEPLLSEVVIRRAANDEDGTGHFLRRRWLYAGGAVAASVAATLMIAPQLKSQRYDIATTPGERRSIRLDSTTVVVLNGATTMTFDRKDPRFAALATGEALFRVRHDAARPFTLEIGGRRVTDVGTVFNVSRQSPAGTVRVAVAEGSVVYGAPNSTIPLRAGQALTDTVSGRPARVVTVPIAGVGGWREGRFVYTGEPLSQVAEDLSRALGIRITISPNLALRPFSGNLMLDGTGPGQLRALAPALDVTMRGGPQSWTMEPATGAHR